VLFPQNGPNSGSGIVRTGAGTFLLPAIGTYQISWQASIDEAGQLDLWLDPGTGAIEQSTTVAGRATGTNQIVNTVLITTTVPGTVLTVRNPSGNSPALTITPKAGGTHAVSGWLVIEQLA